MSNLRVRPVLWILVLSALVVLSLSSMWGLQVPQWLSAARSAQAQYESGECSNPLVIEEFTGTGTQQTDTFATGADVFRITYEVIEGTSSDEEYTSSLFIDVIGADGTSASSATQDGAGVGELIVAEPPGNYYLDITFEGGEGASYTALVEECGGDDTNYQYETAPLFESGGPGDGPVPPMPDGLCPVEYPELRGGSCWR